MKCFIIIEEPSEPIFIDKIVIEVSTVAVTRGQIFVMNIARTCDSLMMSYTFFLELIDEVTIRHAEIFERRVYGDEWRSNSR